MNSPDDNSALLRVAWDANSLYFAIEVKDEAVVIDSTEVWRDDGVELGIDGDYDRARTTTPPDHQYTLVADGRFTDFAQPLATGAYAVRQSSDGYIMEFAIPAAHVLGYGFELNSKLGFTWALHDDDDGGNWDSWMISAGSQTATHYEEFGDLILSGTPIDFPSSTRMIEARRAISPPTIDGDLSEWPLANATELNTARRTW